MPARVRRVPIGLIAIAPLAIGFAVYAFTGQAQVAGPNATPTVDATSSASLTAIVIDGTLTATPTSFWDGFETSIAGYETPTPDPALNAWGTPTPGPQAQHGDFHEGAWVRVNAGEGDCLNARNQPGLENEWMIVNTCLPHGFEGYLVGEAQYADGHWWWFVAGTGWVAEDYLVFVRDEQIRARTLPQLAGKGRIAFIRRDAEYRSELWVMNADGSGQRLVRAARPDEWINDIDWTPNGDALTFSSQRGDGSQAWDVHIVPIDAPQNEIVVENAFGLAWAPDGLSFGTIAEPLVDGMSGGAKGLPAIVDMRSLERRVLSDKPFWMQLPPAFNYDGSKLMYTYSSDDAEDPAPRIVITDLNGAEISRVAMAADSYFGSPRWSPVDDRIEFHVGSSTGQPQYAVWDVHRADYVAAARVPQASDKIGGRCGGWNMWSAAWSRDGRKLYYSFAMGETGANGIWVWDVESGRQSLAPAINASKASAGPDGYAVFSSQFDDAYIFVVPPEGGFPLLLTDGMSPVWSP